MKTHNICLSETDLKYSIWLSPVVFLFLKMIQIYASFRLKKNIPLCLGTIFYPFFYWRTPGLALVTSIVISTDMQESL